MLRRLPILALLPWLSSCLGTVDSAELTRTSDGPATAVSCSACHAYVLQDPDHSFHLVNAGLYVKKVNGSITCLDCHRNSIQSAREVLADSIFQESNGSLSSSLDQPAPIWIRTGTFLRVDTVIQNHPIPSGRASPADGGLQEWMTGMAHLNGRVDVDFDSAVSDTARFNGSRARYDPRMETCSAVSCHPRSGDYRFQACSKNLPGLRGGNRPLSSCLQAP